MREEQIVFKYQAQLNVHFFIFIMDFPKKYNTKSNRSHLLSLIFVT